MMRHSGPTGLPARGSSRRSRLVYSEVPWFEGYAPLKKSEKRGDLNRKFEKWRILYSELWRLSTQRVPWPLSGISSEQWPLAFSERKNHRGKMDRRRSVGLKRNSGRTAKRFRLNPTRAGPSESLRPPVCTADGIAVDGFPLRGGGMVRPNGECQVQTQCREALHRNGAELGNRLRTDVAGGAERDRSLRVGAP